MSNRADSISFNVQLSEPSDIKIAVDFATFDRSAKAGKNYQDTTGTLTFEPGQTEQYIDVILLNNPFAGNSIEFLVTLSNPSGVELHKEQNKAVGTIFNE